MVRNKTNTLTSPVGDLVHANLCYFCGKKSTSLHIVPGHSVGYRCQLCLSCLRKAPYIDESKTVSKPAVAYLNEETGYSLYEDSIDSEKDHLERLCLSQHKWLKNTPKPILHSEFFEQLEELLAIEKHKKIIWRLFQDKYRAVILPKLPPLEEKIVCITRNLKQEGLYYFAPAIIYHRLDTKDVEEKEFRQALNNLVYRYYVYQIHRSSGVLEFLKR